MTEGPGYNDLRQALWRACFEKALPYEAYLAASPAAHRAKWEAMADRIALSGEQAARIGTFTRRIHVLCHSGVWCGDCVRQGPMLGRIAGASDSIRLRFLERGGDDRATDELRIAGAMKVPVAVFLSEDFFEVARYGDRTLAAYRRKARRELGPACDAGIVPPEAGELAAELAEWIDLFERVHWILRLSPPLRTRHGD